MARILLIEDEDLVRCSLRRALETAGHEVYEATDGEEAVVEFKTMIAKEMPSDVVVTDILMPAKDGYETIKEMREIQPDAKIIAISGGGGGNPSVLLEISNFLGANRILSKPFTPDELLGAVHDCLS